MTVEQFEGLLRDEMLTEKFREMVTDGVTVSPQDIAQEFLWRNEKVKIDYALIKPADLAASIHPSDADLSSWFAKNAASLSGAGTALRALCAARYFQASGRHASQRR